MKLHLFSYFFSLFLNLIFLTGLFSSFYWATSKVKEEEIKVSLISKGIESLEVTEFTKGTESLTQTNKVLSNKKNNKLKEEELSTLIGKLKAKKAEEKFSKLNQEEVEELEGKLRNLKEKSQGEGKIQGKGISQEKGIPQGNIQEGLSIDYLLLIKRKLQTNFEVPIYLKQKTGLKATVSLEISPKGEILNYKFIQSSKEPLFDQAVERCLKISQPFPVKNKVKIVIEFKAEGIGKIN